MEKLILGTGVKGSKSAAGKNQFCDFAITVKKGHEECGDSGFAYDDGQKLIIAVLDGVSGEPGAAAASSEAAIALLNFLKKHDKINGTVMKEAFAHAQENVTSGFTTAAALFLQKNGSFMIASVGDSPIYGIEKPGELSLELPISRPVGDKDSILKFFTLRNLVTSVLGPSGTDVHINMASGTFSKGQVLILASDGLTDNLYMATSEGYLTDSSGKADLMALIGKEKKPAAIAKKLMAEVAKRLKAGRKEKENGVLVPKQDDIAIAVVRRL
ncbi:SpoIIE family protein phosphatase [Candidatus Micrarchaeota archaeon]|nr:SpoIIE family protein phosphatase [Candidatus Micrarchaeota archaeon]